MPTYEYRCRECGEPLEVVQAFSDDPLTECPACGGPLRKVFNSVGISFKGSGFYKTDSRSSSSSSSSSSSDGGSSSSETSSSETSSSTSSSSPSSGDSSSSKTPASTT
jgi:putative FmdB family regulatory protein